MPKRVRDRRDSTDLCYRCAIRIRSMSLWAGLVGLVVLGVFAAVARVVAITGVADWLTTARLDATNATFPDFAAEAIAIEQHFSVHATVSVVHVMTGAALLILGLLQFSPSIRTRHLRFHRLSGRGLVALSFVAGLSGIWMGVIDPYSTSERAPTAAAGVVMLAAPLLGIAAARRGDVRRHREWMMRFYAVAVGVVVIRLAGGPIFWLLRPAPIRETIGLSFWAGWLISLAVAEMRIRWTREPNRLSDARVAQTPV